MRRKEDGAEGAGRKKRQRSDIESGDESGYGDDEPTTSQRKSRKMKQRIGKQNGKDWVPLIMEIMRPNQPWRVES